MTGLFEQLPELSAGELHLVRCKACKRPLWDPQSRARQVGRECDEQDFAARSGPVEQDVLPGL